MVYLTEMLAHWEALRFVSYALFVIVYPKTEFCGALPDIKSVVTCGARRYIMIYRGITSVITKDHWPSRVVQSDFSICQ